MSATRHTLDIFCRVIDNHGDVGVCWRLSADLAARGHRVRLWIDDASALAWMAPQGAPGVEVRPHGTGVTPDAVLVDEIDDIVAFLRTLTDGYTP